MFEGEFGWETMAVVPYAYWLHHTCGKLASTQSCGHMSAWYWFSPNHTNHVGCHRAAWTRLEPPKNNSFHGVVKWDALAGNFPVQWEPPPHKEQYRRSNIRWPRQHPHGPSIMILNKFRDVVRHGDPVSDFWLDAYDFPILDQVLSAIKETCPEANVLYHREFADEIDLEEHDIGREDMRHLGSIGMNPLTGEEILLESPARPMPFPGNQTDWQWLQQYSFVSRTLDAFKQTELPSNQYNNFLMGAMSRHNCFISVQGGLQASSAWFGGKSVVLNSDPDVTFELDYNFYEGGAPKFAGGEFTKVLDRSVLIQTVKDQLLTNACQACALS